MKKISFIFAIVFAIAAVSCNPKKEHTPSETEIADISEVVEDESDVIDEYDSTENVVAVVDSTKKDTTAVVTPKNEGKEPIMVENEDGSVKKVGDEEIKKEAAATHVKKFYVVAGSFKNINNAVELRQFFKKSGYPAMILYPYNGYNRVATGSFPDRVSAEKEIKKFRSMNLTYEGGKIEYWLLWR